MIRNTATEGVAVVCRAGGQQMVHAHHRVGGGHRNTGVAGFGLSSSRQGQAQGTRGGQGGAAEKIIQNQNEIWHQGRVSGRGRAGIAGRLLDGVTPIFVVAALGGGAGVFQLAGLFPAAEICRPPAFACGVSDDAGNDFNFAAAVRRRWHDARGQRQGSHCRHKNIY